MVSEEELRNTTVSLLSNLVGQGFPYGKVAEGLSVLENAKGLELSSYGYVMYAIEHYGHKCAWKNVLASDAAMRGYAEAAEKFRDDMPGMLVNAHTYVTKLLANVADLDTCLKQLEGMSFPYVLYILFAGSGEEEVVKRYRAEAEEQLKRYPSTLDKLPDSYRKIGEGLLNADAQ